MVFVTSHYLSQEEAQPRDPAPKSEPFTKARLTKSMSPLLLGLYETATIQKELKALPNVLKVDCAHIVMLAEVGIIDKSEAGQILQVLNDLRQAGSDCFVPKSGYGSIALQIEAHLGEKLGQAAAGRLPIARSRIDHSATVRRMSDRYAILDISRAIIELQQVLLEKASRHGETAVLSYTHMQQAQPATFGHYLLSFHSRLDDSFQQLSQVYYRSNRSPLGAVGLSGTDLPINRQRTASLLGFAEVLDNSRLGRDAYYQIEFVFTLALLATILNDLCTDLHIQSSIEYGTVELDDTHCSTSSIFPQKKNPIALEIIKGKAGEASGWAAAALGAFRNEGTGDQQARAVSCLTDACITITNMLKLTSEVVERLTVNEQRCQELLSNAWVTTNRLGNVLFTEHGLDYRTAHGLVARLVKASLASGTAKQDIDVGVLEHAAAEMSLGKIHMTNQQLQSALDYNEFISSCVSQGSVGPEQFRRLLDTGRAQIRANEDSLEERLNYLVHSDDNLASAVTHLIAMGRDI